MGKIDQVRSSLYTPQGEHPLTERDVIVIDRRAIMALAWLHEFAFHHKVALICEKCGQPIKGVNSGNEPQPAVSCLCREFRYAGGR